MATTPHSTHSALNGRQVPHNQHPEMNQGLSDRRCRQREHDKAQIPQEEQLEAPDNFWLRLGHERCSKRTNSHKEVSAYGACN